LGELIMKNTPLDYQQRYPENYLKRVYRAHQHHRKIAGGWCCHCLVRQAEQMHHTSYGNDRLGYNWFGVCVTCHKYHCHSKLNWIKQKGKAAIWGNANTPEFTNKLRRNYQFLINKPK
jgi:hypothetical protein